MSLPHPSSLPPGAADGALSRGVRRAAAVAARRPKTIIALWLLFVVGCVFAGGAAGTKTLSDTETGAGQSKTADERIEAAGLRDPAVESVLIRSGDATTTAAAAADLSKRLQAGDDVTSVQGPAGAPELSTNGGRIVLVQARLRGDPDDAGKVADGVGATVKSAHAAHPGVSFQQAGDGSFESTIDQVVTDDLQRAEVISLPLTLLVLIVAFGALVAACVPLVLGITAVAAAMGALGVVSQIAPSTDTTASVVVLIGLAVGVDYSLFYIRREREERRAGRGPDAALDAAAASVGRAILISGLTVMIALGGLLLSGNGVFVSIGLATMLVVAIAVLGSLTVLPAMLALLGDRIDKGRLPRFLRRRPRPAGKGFWAALARLVTRRPVAALVVSISILAALAVPALQLKTGDAGLESLPADIPVVQAEKAIQQAFPGAPSNASLVVTAKGLDGKRDALKALGQRGAKAVGGTGAVHVEVSRDGGTAVVDVPMPSQGQDAERHAVDVLRDEVAPTAPGGHALVTGDAAASADFSDQMKSATPIVIAFVMALAFALLLWAFRSPKLAATVIGLNLLSVGAAFGLMAAVFQHSWAEGLLGFESSGAIVSWLPLFSFVVLFGLSMDYTVLVLERIQEARRAGRSPAAAAAEGVGATAGTVTSAAIVMVAIFAVFATLRLLDMKQMGFGLAAAVLLDVTLVRGVALPAAIALLGDRGWRVKQPRARRVRDRERVEVAA
jgi:uncharacterized membrane protein YdfJ with MMPL/SSD domain